MIHIFVVFFLYCVSSVILYVSQFYFHSWIIALIGAFLCFYRLFFHYKNKVFFLVLFCFLGIGIFLYVSNKIHILERNYQAGFEENIELKGVITEFPSYRFSNNQYIILLDNQKTQVLVYTHSYQKFAYLDTLSFGGSLQDVRQQDPKWHSYYQKLGVQYIAWYPSVSDVQHAKPQTFKEYILFKLFSLKSFIRNKSIEKFSSHTSTLVLGMLLGEKDELSKEEKDIFNTANLSHILVVSGYNISLVISFVFILLKNISKHTKTVCALIFVFLFVLLVGFDASVVRSALMGSIVIIGKTIYRQSSGIHTLVLVATGMLVHNPFIIFDAGFHLSFLATYSLLILPGFKKIPEYILTTLWVFVWVSLYILYLSGSTSFVGIFTARLALAQATTTGTGASC